METARLELRFACNFGGSHPACHAKQQDQGVAFGEATCRLSDAQMAKFGGGKNFGAFGFHVSCLGIRSKIEPVTREKALGAPFQYIARRGSSEKTAIPHEMKMPAERPKRGRPAGVFQVD